MPRRPRPYLIRLLVTLLIPAAALFIFSLFGGKEVAVGPLVLRVQKGSVYPLNPPPDSGASPGQIIDRTGGVITGGPDNVVLFIGDGMGIGHVSAAAALLDRPGGVLAMMETPFVGLVRTWASNALVTDSAASGTAFATGYKTRRKMVGLLPDGTVPRNLFEAAQERGLLTGVITTSGLVDATPACFTSHVAHRDSYDDILVQMLASGATVLMGGDFSKMRKAKRNKRYRRLAADIERLGGERGFNVIRDPAAVDGARLPILALFPPREGYPQQHGPPLAVSARHAVVQLLEAKTPFLLVIESEMTDSRAHANDIKALMEGMREFDQAVAEIIGLVAARGDTLVLVTADHDTGALALTGGRYKDGRATVRWASGRHSSQWTPLFAFGPGADVFTGILDNTDVAKRIARLLRLGPIPHPADSGGK